MAGVDTRDMACVDGQMGNMPTASRDEGKAEVIATEAYRASRTSSNSQDTLESKKEEPVGLRDPFASDEASVSEGDIEFRSLKWWQCSMVMIAETISLGILSLPKVLATVGLIPGFILIIGLGAFASYSGYVIGQFKQRYPHVHSMGDAAEILCRPLGFPRIGREIGGAGQVGFLIFAMGSHILTWVICFNTISGNATCSIVWGVVALIIFWLCDLPRTLKNMSHMSIFSFFSVGTAVIITMVATGIKKPGTGINAYSLWPEHDPAHPLVFWKAFLSVTNIVFAYAGHVAFFSFISELRNPEEFPKALAMLQICDITLYVVVAVVVYRFGGQKVPSPALSAAGELIAKIAYGLAIPTIIIAGVIYGHVASKYIYIRVFGAQELKKKTWGAFAKWALLTLLLWTIAWIIAESIPNFEELLGVVSSIFASWFTYGFSGIFWLFMNKGRWFSSPTKSFLTIVNCTLIVLAVTVCFVGLYASGTAIHDSDGKGGSWSCKSGRSVF